MSESTKITQLISQQTIQNRLKELAEEINAEFAEVTGEVVILCILKGGAVFAADLIRHLNFPLILEFIELQSYRGTNSSGRIDVVKCLSPQFAGKNVLVVDDITDTGSTLQYVQNLLSGKNLTKLKFCTFLDKPSRRAAENVRPDFVGITIPDVFVVGYGLDYNQKYRNIPYIATIEQPINGG